jgi:hypothetical protein
MLQALDLAKENAALIHEVAQLRQQLGEFVPTAIPELTGMPGVLPSPHGAEYASDGAVRLVVVLPRYHALHYDSPAGRPTKISEGEVIIDRRVVERRRGEGARHGKERRARERRSHQLQLLAAVVWDLP